MEYAYKIKMAIELLLSAHEEMSGENAWTEYVEKAIDDLQPIAKKVLDKE